MRCPACRRRVGSFVAGSSDLRPRAESACPHCRAGLRVGWWPAAGILAAAAATLAAMLWVGDWVAAELGLPHGRAGRWPRRLVQVVVAAAVGLPGVYAVWVVGWYARRPAGVASDADSAAAADTGGR